MSLGLILYGLFSRIIGLFSGRILAGRVRKGKEDPDRLHQRVARNLPDHPSGPVVWLHAASVGESLILLELGKRIQAARPNVFLLFTSQTLTSAETVQKNLPERALHQMAPLDTPGAAKRFVRHWKPELGIFAEGDIWPNLTKRAHKAGVPLAIVNARMTQKSLKGWRRWNRMAKRVFGRFDVILAADEQTSEGLNEILGPVVTSPGNLKSSLPPPGAEPMEIKRLLAGFKDQRHCFVAASTHEGEEELVLNAVEKMSEAPALIIAPRHPERGDALERLIQSRGLSISRRSRGDPYSTETDVILADTLGEMGVWYRIADAIYLGGGHAKGVGGHNPLEPLKLGKSVITGAEVFNFADMMETLAGIGAVRVAEDAHALATLILEPCQMDHVALRDWLDHADHPMRETLEAIRHLLEPRS